MAVPHIFDDNRGAIERGFLDENFAAVSGSVIVLSSLSGLVIGSGVSAAARAKNSTVINAAILAAKASFSYVQLPGGVIEFSGTLNAQNGVVVQGVGNFGENSISLYIGSILTYTGSVLAVNMVGASPLDSRIQCSWRDLVINGYSATSPAEGVKWGWNQRSVDLLRNVTIVGFPSHGLHAVDQNWNVSFTNLRVDTCGRLTNNTSGIFKDAAIDASTWNGISFHNLQVEGCGTASSSCGGIWLPTTTANRGLYFSGFTICEGNFGTCETSISNMFDMHFEYFYCERVLNVVGQQTCMEVIGGSGAVTGGYLTGSGANNLQGFRIASGAQFGISNVTFGAGTFSVGAVVNLASRVWTYNLFNATYSDNVSSVWRGDYAPEFAIVYSANMTPDFSQSLAIRIDVSNGVAWFLSTPTPPASGSVVYLRIRNTSGGAMGAISTSGAFKMAALTGPANGFQTTLAYRYDGAAYSEINRSTGAIPN